MVPTLAFGHQIIFSLQCTTMDLVKPGLRQSFQSVVKLSFHRMRLPLENASRSSTMTNTRPHDGARDTMVAAWGNLTGAARRAFS